MGPQNLTHRHGVRIPRNAATLFEVLSWITFVVSILAGLILMGQGGAGVAVGLAVGASGVISGSLLRAVSIAMNWMATMYELAARGFEPEEAAVPGGAPPPVDSGRAHRRAA